MLISIWSSAPVIALLIIVCCCCMSTHVPRELQKRDNVGAWEKGTQVAFLDYNVGFLSQNTTSCRLRVKKRVKHLFTNVPVIYTFCMAAETYYVQVIDVTSDDDTPVADRSGGAELGPINIIYTSDSELDIDHDNEKRRFQKETRSNNVQELKHGRVFESHASATSSVSNQYGAKNKCYSDQRGQKCSNLQNDKTSNYGVDLKVDNLSPSDRSFSSYNTSDIDNSSSKKRRQRHKQRQRPNDSSPIGSFNCFQGNTGEYEIDSSCYAKKEKEVVSSKNQPASLNSFMFSSESYNTDRANRIIDERSVYEENIRIDGRSYGFVVIDRDDVPADEFNEYLESQKFSRSEKTGRKSYCFIL